MKQCAYDIGTMSRIVLIDAVFLISEIIIYFPLYTNKNIGKCRNKELPSYT